MGIALVNHAIAHTGAATTITTGAIDTSGANFVICFYSFDASLGTPPAMSDNKSNGAGTNLTRNTGTISRSNCRFTYYTNPTVGAGHTFTATASASITGTLAVAAFSGVKVTTPADQQAAAGHAGSGSTTIQTGSVTPVEDNELLVAGWAIDDPTNTTWTINGGYSITDIQDVITGATYGGVLAYLVQGALAATNPTFTRSNAISSAREDTASIASFKQEPGAAGTGLPPLGSGGADQFIGLWEALGLT